MNSTEQVKALCAEFGVEVIPGNMYPKPGQTRAVATMRRIIEKRGESHLRLVMSTLAETRGNEGLITEMSLWATSDLVLACGNWIEEDVSSWLEAWDQIPLGFLMWNVQELSGISHSRHALAGAIYTMLVHYSKGKKANREVDFSFIRRVEKAEDLPSRREVRQEEARAMGEELMRVREALQPAQFIPWLKESTGLSLATAHRYMRMARHATPHTA